jgi:ABC-type multidrug transport system fused ATPase/permease subunit
LLRRPRFLILDEPTSALDIESEDQIVRTIEDLKGTTTIVLVSHRLNAVRGADLVYTLDSGSIRPLGLGQEVYERARDVVF